MKDETIGAVVDGDLEGMDRERLVAEMKRLRASADHPHERGARVTEAVDAVSLGKIGHGKEAAFIVDILSELPECVRSEVAARLDARGEPWPEDDAPLPEDERIDAAFPTKTGRHDLYGEAMRLVGAKRSKHALVKLVNWLLAEAAASSEALEVLQRQHVFLVKRHDREMRELVEATGIAWQGKSHEERVALVRDLRSRTEAGRAPEKEERMP